jgi:core-2/I-Branching enzyme
MKLAFVVLAHHRPAQLAVLLGRLRHAETRIYLHVDRRSRLAPFNSELTRNGVDEVELLPRHRCHWGAIGGVDAALDGLRKALHDGCDYFVLLSGQDLPLRPIAEIVRYFDERRQQSFIDYFSLPDPRWAYGGRARTEFYSYDLLGRRETCFPKEEEPELSFRGRLLNGLLRIWTARKAPRRFPQYLRPFGGSSWWNLDRAAAEFVLSFVARHPDYRAYHEHTLSADEIFFQSILMGDSFPDGHEVVNDSLRFTIWPPKSSHPKTLRSEDLAAMLESGKPFARKFDLEVDRAVIEKLPA